MELLDYSVKFLMFFSVTGPQRAWHLIQSHSDCYGMKSLCNFLKQWEPETCMEAKKHSGLGSFLRGTPRPIYADE